jgi:hypothetical protein
MYSCYLVLAWRGVAPGGPNLQTQSANKSMTAPETRPATSRHELRWYQYSLAGLLGLTTILSVVLSLLKWLQINFGFAGVAWVIIFAIAGALYVGSVAWAIADAQKRGCSGGLVVLLFAFLGPMGAVVWLFVRPSPQVVIRPPAEYADPDDALAAALQLDMQGDWDAAVAVYGAVARRWPEHEKYVQGCITRLEEKRSRL